MDNYVGIGLLILLGLLLILIEIIFIPGTTIVGILGFIALIVSIWMGFQKSREEGLILLGVSGIAGGLMFYWAFQKKAWKRFSLQTENHARLSQNHIEILKVGDVGVTISALRPTGTAQFSEGRVEVQALSQFVEVGQQVQIIEITANEIFVNTL